MRWGDLLKAKNTHAFKCDPALIMPNIFIETDKI